MRCRSNALCWGAMVLMAFGLVQSAAPDLARAEGQESVGSIHFDAPAGWKAVDQPGKTLRMYVPPDVNATDQAVIIVAFGDPGGEFRAQFDQLVKSAMATRKVIKTGQLHEGRSRQGLPVLSQNLTAEGDNGSMILARFVAADVSGRPALLCYIATLPDAYESHHAAVEQMLASVSFGDAPPAAATDGASKPAAPAADEPPQKSPEQLAREADNRRKAHTVLGDIVDRNGQPIKGARGSVYVGGTTIRGDRSSYSLEIDDKGHFEMVIPDGVYRITPTLSVEYDGKTLPVQLVPMDGKPGHSFSSAEGIVQDFRWVLLGRRPGVEGDSYVSYFGGHVGFSDQKWADWGHQMKDRWPAGTKLRVVLTPTGPLIDGSEGRPAIVEVDLKQLATQQAGALVPIGVYKVAAELLTPDGRRQRALLSRDAVVPQRAPEVEIHFSRGSAVDDVNSVSIWFSDGAG